MFYYLQEFPNFNGPGGALDLAHCWPEASKKCILLVDNDTDDINAAVVSIFKLNCNYPANERTSLTHQR